MPAVDWTARAVLLPRFLRRPEAGSFSSRLNRHVGRAHGVATGDRRQPLYVRSEQVGERRGLGLTQLWELGGDMRDRAVMLAQLRARSHIAGRGGVTLLGQRESQRFRPLRRLRSGGHRLAVRIDHRGHPAPGERADRLLTTALREEPECGDGEVVVGVPEPGPSRIGEQELFRRPATTPMTAPRRVPRARLAVGDEGVEMPANRRWAEPKRVRHRGRGDRATL